MQITEEFIHQVKQTADIADYIGRFVTLKNVAGNLKGKCPFHDEKTASFNVNQKESYYKCFGCGKSGDLIQFVQEYDKLSFPEAIKRIAAAYNMELPDGEKPQKKGPKISMADAPPESVIGTAEYNYDEEISEANLRIFFGKRLFFSSGPDELKTKLKKMREIMQRFNWRTATSYTFITKNMKAMTIEGSPDYPIFVRDEGAFQKIYQPLNSDKEFRFSYTGKKPSDYINGFKQLQKSHRDFNVVKEEEHKNGPDREKPYQDHKLDECILAAGERDAMNWAYVGYFPVWRNSETATLSKQDLKDLFLLCKSVYNAPNIDNTGINEMHKLSMCDDDLIFLNVKNVVLPDELAEKRDARGGLCNDVRDYLDWYNGGDLDKLVNTSIPYRFWDVSYKKDEERIWGNKKALYNFLYRNGFGRFKSPTEKTGHFFIHKKQHVVRQVQPSEIRDFVMSFLFNRRVDPKIENVFYNNPILSDSSLENLPFMDLDFKTYDSDTQFLFFKEEIWKITGEEIEKQRPKSTNKAVWEDKVIRHDVNLTDSPFTWVIEDKNPIISIIDESSVFLKYIHNTSKINWRKAKERALTPEEEAEENLHLANKLFTYGYLLHRYKAESRAYWVYAMEHKYTPDDESHGGTGKSIFFKSLRHLISVETENGRDRAAMDNKHLLEGISLKTDLFFFDELDKYFRFEKWFMAVTGDLKINPKGLKSYTVLFEDSCKFASASNYPLIHTDPSVNRRLLYIIFSDWYHSENDVTGEDKFSPNMEFQYELFSRKMPKEQWNKFYNFAARCIQFYLDFMKQTDDKVDPPMNDVLAKTTLASIGENFKNWADVLLSKEGELLDCILWKHELLLDYQESTKSKDSVHMFKKRFVKWCRFKGYEMCPAGLINDLEGHRILRQNPNHNKTMECFYFRTMDENGNWREINDSIKQIQTGNRRFYNQPAMVEAPVSSSSGGNDDDPF